MNLKGRNKHPIKSLKICQPVQGNHEKSMVLPVERNLSAVK